MWEEARDKMRILKTPAKDKLEGKVKEGNPWRRNRGRATPPIDDIVEVRFRDGDEAVYPANELDWSMTGHQYGWEITKWRPHVATAEQSWEVAQDVPEHIMFGHASHEAYEQHIKMVVGTEDDFKPTAAETESARRFFEGPLQWRDRINAIDAEQKAADESHKAATDARTAERAGLVQKLASEGLALLGKADAAPVEDMSDWRNWKAGDSVIFTRQDNDDTSFHEGGIYVIDYIAPNSCNPVCVVEDDEGEPNGWKAEYFKWHSRPTA